MFSKHVWHDRKHQAEVFITGAGAIGGTIVAYKGAVCVINPRPEILTALYQEAKIKRILSIKYVILTDNTIEFTRGLCALVGYSRGLRRKSPLTILTRDDTRISTDFLGSCCSRLLGDEAFDVAIETLKIGESREVGSGTVTFLPGDENPFLAIRTERRLLHYYDESHTGPFSDEHPVGTDKPNVVIRAAELLPQNRPVRRPMIVQA
jgi:hypothetical protein